MQQLTLTCPYCPARFRVPSPRTRRPHEVACMPYTRDIGKFDDGAWTRIGRDFMGTIVAWDEEVGILRVPANSGIHVWYRVATCPRCDHPFDVFANFTPKRKMADFWPHLFAEKSGRIQQYLAHNHTTALLAWIARSFGPGKGGRLTFALVFLGFALLPQVAQQARHGMSIEFWVRLIAGLVGVGMLMIIWNVLAAYSSHMQKRSSLTDLLAFRSMDHTMFWSNFTYARFVGVQASHGRRKLTQADLIAGIPSVIVMICVWFIFHVREAGVQPMVTMLVVFAGLGFVVGSQVFTQRTHTSLLPVTARHIRGTLAGIALWLIFMLGRLIAGSSLVEVVVNISYLLFWLMVAYFVGIVIHFSFSLSIYVLRAVRALPLQLSPLNRYKHLEVLDHLAAMSFSSLALIVFLMLVLLVIYAVPLPAEIQHATDQLWWVASWGVISLVLFLVLLGFALSRYVFIAAGAYGAGLLFLPSLLRSVLTVCGDIQHNVVCFVEDTRFAIHVTSDPVGEFIVFPDILLLGIFLSIVAYVHARVVARIIRETKERVRDRQLQRYDTWIRAVQHIMERRKAAYPSAQSVQYLNNLVALRDYIERQPVSLSVMYRVFSVAMPFISTIILPIFFDVLGEWIATIVR